MAEEMNKEERKDITEKLRKNPWILSTFALVILSVVLLASSLGNFSFTGNVISSSEAGDLLISAYPGVSVDSVKEISGVYQVNVLYQGQIVPLYVTKDGQYAGQLSLLDDSVSGTDTTANTDAGTVAVSEDDDAVLGKANAPVTIIEFSDYQCPFCRKFWTEKYSQIKSEYIDTGKVKLVFRDFPLSFHPMAQASAEAAECVREKGGDSAYFKYHDKLFSEQNILDGGTVKSTIQYTEADLKSWAKEIGYDIGSCLDSGKYSEEVQNDLADGQSAGISGTPGFVINGISVSGAQPFSVFEQIIEGELSA